MGTRKSSAEFRLVPMLATCRYPLFYKVPTLKSVPFIPDRVEDCGLLGRLQHIVKVRHFEKQRGSGTAWIFPRSRTFRLR